jgi:NDP-hexose-3-ketoreductase
VSGTVNVALIGCGAIARRAHLPGLLAAGARVTAVASGRLESAQSLAAECGATAVADWRELLLRDDVDAVVISTPNVLHYEQAVAALSAGKHVLVEKPMTATTDEAERLVDEGARRPGLVLMPAQNARFAPLVVEAAARARATQIRSLRVALRNSGPLAWSPGSTWFLDLGQSGGGALLDLGVHVLDVARCVLGEDLVVESATVTREDGVDVEGAVRLRSPSGVEVNAEVSWRSATPGFELALSDAGGLIDVRPNLGVPADTVQAAFVRAVTTGAPYSPTALDGRAAVGLVHDAYAVAM